MKRLIPVLAMCAVSVAARADIITALASTPTATGNGYYAYTYNVELTGGQLDPTNGGTPVQFGTVYDFGALQSVNGATLITSTGLLASNAGLFSFSFDATDQPASTTGLSIALADDPNLTNIRFTYIGSNGVDVLGQNTTLGATATTVIDSPDDLGTFTVYSPYNTLNTSGTYDGQTFKGTNNTQQANFGLLSVPQATAAATPEPSSLALLGTGLLGVAGVMRRKLTQA